MNKCSTCAFAQWEKTKAGKLHPNGNGQCKWEKSVPLAYSTSTFSFATKVDEKVITFRGGIIDRKSAEPRICRVYQQAE